jgi:hypothetical protein
MFNTEKGTILYFSVLILSILFTLSIGLSLIIFTRMRIQREIGYSVIALSAADTGVERALYAIYKEGNLAFSETANLENGASYNVSVATSSNQCVASVQYYCIQSKGMFKGVIREIDASF